MDYNKIKLGLTGRTKIWRAIRDAKKDQKLSNEIEGETSDVDYSYVDELQTELLNEKRIRKATRRAEKVFKKRNTKISLDKDKFIEQYLIDNGLKQKTLSETEENRKHSFMDKYSTEKTAEEVAYEQSNQRHEIYYNTEKEQKNIRE